MQRWSTVSYGLNPFQYFNHLFEHLPNTDIQQYPEHLDAVLLWNKTIQQNLALTDHFAYSSTCFLLYIFS